MTAGLRAARRPKPGKDAPLRALFCLIAVVCLTALTAGFFSVPARAAETDARLHDPSTVVKRGGTYWVYGTGTGVPQFSSPDRVHWTFRGPVFPAAPAWVASAVPANRGNFAWAPDIHFFGGRWLLYYCYSSFGSNTSAIGVATNKTLDPKTWADSGLVLRTGKDTNDNAIDPCLFEDAAGKPWLCFGSYFSGIELIAIDPETGKPAAANPIVTPLASRPRTPPNAIEASCIYYHGGYYYLFVNWDRCCAGPRSTYNIRMGRAKAVTGPYQDKAGVSLLDGGGTLFLGAVADDGSGRPCDDQVGPGHAGFLTDGSETYISYHEEWTRDQGGRSTLNLSKLAWDADGWPRVVLDPGPYKIVSALASHGIISQKTGTPVVTTFDSGGPGQRWTLDSLGDGCYRLLSGGRALTVSGDAPGAPVVMAPRNNRPGQAWRLRQNEDGTYTLRPNAGAADKPLALDISGCSLADGAVVQAWTDNGLDCQKWSFRRR